MRNAGYRITDCSAEQVTQLMGLEPPELLAPPVLAASKENGGGYGLTGADKICTEIAEQSLPGTNSTIMNNLPNEDGTPHHNEENNSQGAVLSDA